MRLLTDPLLRHGWATCAATAPPRRRLADGLDAVLISHLHLDHLDPPSLRMIDRDTGDRRRRCRPHAQAAGLRATYARWPPATRSASGDVASSPPMHEHDGRRRPMGGAEADTIGFVVEAGDTRVYFAGDTDLFPGMEAIGATDLALLPVWGWGPTLGDGHMDPARGRGPPRCCDRAWPCRSTGARSSRWARSGTPEPLTEPPHEFAR